MLPESTNNFWTESTDPLMILAPMEDVTDTAFRELVMRISQPGALHVVYTEFTSTDGLCHPVGRARVEERLKVSQSERELLRKLNVKIVAQIWGKNPGKYAEAVRYITEEYNFDGIDINMGCPVRNVVAQGSCSALIDNESLAGEIIAATRESTTLPLSLKTRLGVKKIDTERWISFLLQQPLDAIILHGRIQKQMSEGEARWDEIAKAVRLRDAMAPHIKLIGNGDVASMEDAREKMEFSGADGAMIGRGIFANPWLFNSEIREISTPEKLETLLLHLELFEKNWGHTKPFVILRRFFKIYLSGFPGASALRSAMMEVKGFDEARDIIGRFLIYSRSAVTEDMEVNKS
ncbi:MAG: tRNA-dihydrouridine synthase family protein [Bacteroidetes bacterium]|nr:MAG: tRNA-dihydrouridine synthase family protein [Bacteroidota bacterium]